MPSSTSNSDSHIRDIPNQPWAKLVIAAIAVFIVAMAGWEAFARKMQHLPGTQFQGFGKMWTLERRKLDRPNNIRIVLTGSSRMMWAADLDILEDGFGERPLQLALPGTGPALIVEDIVNNTDFDGLILVGVTSFLFNRLDEGFFGGEAFDNYHNEAPSQWAGTKIHRLLSKHLGFLDEAFALPELLERYSDLPVREGAENLLEKDWKLGDHYEDLQTDMWPPVETPGSFDNQQITNFWTPGLKRPPETPERMAEMSDSAIAFFTPLIDTLRARGGDMVFILMPADGLYLEHDKKTNYFDLTWQPMSDGFNAAAVNSYDYPELSSNLQIPEWSHLSRASQDLWSRDVVPIIKAQYLATRNKPIDDVIEPRLSQ